MKKEKSKTESTGPVEVKPFKKRGHEFSETCNCIGCIQKSYKQGLLIRKSEVTNSPEIDTDKIIETYLQNLPPDTVIVQMTGHVAQMVRDKVKILKDKFPGTNYQEFVKQLTNESLTVYLNNL